MDWGNALSQGSSGAASGAAMGPWGAAAMGAAGVLSGLLGGSSMSPEMKRLYDMQYGIAKQLRGYANSAPLSDRQEQLALAQERGLLGQQQANDQNQLYSALNLNQLTGSLPDALTNLHSQQTGQMMSLNSQALLNALMNRKNALMQASQVAGQAVSPASYQQQSGLPSLLGNIGQLLAYQQARRPQASPVGAGSGGVISGGNFPWNQITLNPGQTDQGFVPRDQSVVIPGVNFNSQF